jgi:putative membrane protein
MKSLGSIMIIALAALFFQACSGNTKNSSTAKNDSIGILRDTTSKQVVNVEKGDVQFAVEAASGGIAEVALGKMAEQRAMNRMVKNFGAMMVKDHSKANDKLAALAKSKNINLPNEPNAGDQQTIDKLMKLSGRDFDKAYISDMIDDHKNDIKEFKYASKNCNDPDIKHFAAKTLPVLQNHLDAINEVRANMK